MLTGREKVLEGAQDLRELLRRQLGCSAGAGAQARQLDDFFACHNLSRPEMPSGRKRL